MDDVEIEVLSLVTEDYYGPWELAVQVPVGRDRLVRAIEGLMGSGLVTWFSRSSDTAEAVHVRRHTPEPPELTDDSLWRAPGPVDVEPGSAGAYSWVVVSGFLWGWEWCFVISQDFGDSSVSG